MFEKIYENESLSLRQRGRIFNSV